MAHNKTMISKFQFDTQDEINQFMDSMFSNQKNITENEVLYQADTHKFATAEVKKMFIESGIARIQGQGK